MCTSEMAMFGLVHLELTKKYTLYIGKFPTATCMNCSISTSIERLAGENIMLKVF